MTAAVEYVPERGDAVWVDLEPSIGHEQGGRRPVIVLSPARANDITDLAVICPVTSRVKGYPFEVELPLGLPVHGAVLVNQIKTIDWRARRIEYIAALPKALVDRVSRRLAKLILPGFSTP